MFLQSIKSLIPKRKLPQILLGFVFALPATAQTITVVGTPHLSMHKPPAASAHYAHTLNRLQKFAPTRVCVESLSGARIAALMQNPARNAEVLSGYARIAVQLAASKQLEVGMGPAEAATAASVLVTNARNITTEERIKLTSLQLAAYNPHSAALNWSYLTPQQRDVAETTLGKATAESLTRMLNSKNEISVLAIPLARQQSLAELCTVDVLDDEMAVADIAATLMPIVKQPEVAPRLALLNDTSAQKWQSQSGDAALTTLLHWYNGPEFSALDRKAQWDIFHDYDTSEGAGGRRLMLWNARNSEISAALFRELSRGGHERVMLLIGAAHRPFIEAQLRSQPWLEVIPSTSYLQDENLLISTQK